MRHKKLDKKFGRSKSHRQAMIASIVGNLIAEKSIRTTLLKAKSARRLAERMVTVARRGTLADRRLLLKELQQPKHVSELFKTIAPQFAGRPGGYTRIIKVKRRIGDGAEMAMLEWVGIARPAKKQEDSAEAKKD